MKQYLFLLSTIKWIGQYILMSQSLKFVIRNARKGPKTQHKQRSNSYNPHYQTIDCSLAGQQTLQLSDRINLLQGNLKVLEHKYKQNLKEGFDHKIKAYRLQAVVQRKLLKQAIEQTQKFHELQQIKEKYQQRQRIKMMQQQRQEIYRIKQEEKMRFIQKRNALQKRQMSLTMRQRQNLLSRQKKKLHDQIAWEESHVDRKKIYFDNMRKTHLKKEQLQEKRDLLSRIVCNTQKLRQLKFSLQQMNEMPLGDTFLTL